MVTRQVSKWHYVTFKCSHKTWSLPDSLGTLTLRTQLSCHKEAKGPWQRGARTCGPNPSLTPSCQPAPTSRPGESAIFKRTLQNLDSIRGQKPDPEGHVLDSSTYMKCPVMNIYRNSDEKLSYIEIYRSHSSLYMLTWSLLFLIFLAVELIYNVVLVSGIQQRICYTCIPSFWDSFPI